jgi:hypothetical protein
MSDDCEKTSFVLVIAMQLDLAGDEDDMSRTMGEAWKEYEHPKQR